MKKKLAIWNKPNEPAPLEVELGALANLYETDEELLEQVKLLEWSDLSDTPAPDNWQFVSKPTPPKKEGEETEIPDRGSWRDLPIKIRSY
jgi:hypothetical protein